MTAYKLSATDTQIVQRASRLLESAIAARLATPAQLVSIGKVLHALKRLPEPTDIGEVSISVVGPRQHHGEIETHFWWDVQVEGDLITVQSGGHFYRPSTGGDTFSSIIWQAVPDHPAELRDFLQQLAIVPELRSFVSPPPNSDELSFGYTLTVEDESNEYLDQVEDESESEEAADDVDGEAWCLIGPRDEYEQQLAAMVDDEAFEVHRPQFAHGVTDCGSCGRDLAECGLFVDGRLRGSAIWANLCARCFIEEGEGIGDGRGQLYAHQPDGSWRLVAGSAGV